MNPAHQLGQLQLAIMRVLWTEGEATVARVHEVLEPEGGRALTTIATMLTKMERKGIVEHRSEGRQFLFRATVSEAEVQRSMVSELTERLFEGDYEALVNHLLTAQEIDRVELARLREQVARRSATERRAKGQGPEAQHGR